MRGAAGSGASGSSTMSARLLVAAGAPDQASAGERSSPWQVCGGGISAPSRKPGEVIVRAMEQEYRAIIRAVSNSAPVLPLLRDGRYLLELADVGLEVDPAVGGRITALRLGGRNLLTGPDVDPGNYGSTFWTSPQSAWSWPPVAEIDSAPYAAAPDGPMLVMRGPASPLLGVAIEKRVSADG